MTMGVFQIVTVRGGKVVAEVYDLESARLLMARLNAEKTHRMAVEARKHNAWWNGYHAAKTAEERAKWLEHKPHKTRVMGDVMLSGVVW